MHLKRPQSLDFPTFLNQTILACTKQEEDSVYTDYSLPCLPSGERDLYYKIQAKDNDQKLSSFSEEAVINNVQWEPKKDELIQTATVIPVEIELYSNYPNPFNPSTNIIFGLPKDDWVEVTIYSVTG